MLPFIGAGGHWCGVEEVEIVAAVARSCAAVAKSWFNQRGDGGVKEDVGVGVRTFSFKRIWF